MQYLIYILAFIPYILCAPTTVQEGVISYTCETTGGRIMSIPVAATRASVQSSCSLSRGQGKKITEFPKAFKPAFKQKLSVLSTTGKYYISPVNQRLYPNAFSITSDGCELAAVMLSGPNGISTPQAATPPGVVNRPANSVRTRPGSPVPQSVRTFRPVVGRSESSTGNLEKRAVLGSALKECSPKTYDWNRDISGTGRKVGDIPVPGSRVPF